MTHATEAKLNNMVIAKLKSYRLEMNNYTLTKATLIIEKYATIIKNKSIVSNFLAITFVLKLAVACNIAHSKCENGKNFIPQKFYVHKNEDCIRFILIV